MRSAEARWSGAFPIGDNASESTWGESSGIKTVEGTSVSCDQQASGVVLNGEPLLMVHLLQNGLVHLQTNELQFLITGAS
jgi:hypothetical protein